MSPNPFAFCYTPNAKLQGCVADRGIKAEVNELIQQVLDLDILVSLGIRGFQCFEDIFGDE